jgi:hypothetical protein
MFPEKSLNSNSARPSLKILAAFRMVYDAKARLYSKAGFFVGQSFESDVCK